MDSDCMLYLVTNSDCMFISKSNQYGKLSLYLPTIQNACSSLLAWVLVQLRLYLPTIQNACSSERNNLIHTLSCTYPLFRMHVHQLELFMVLVGSCTYPLFRMHVHPQINIILYNRHLLNVRALLFLLLNI